MNPILAFVLLMAPAVSAGDTLVDVRPGDHLVLKDFEGRVVVDTWDRPEARAQGESKSDYRFRTTRSGNDLVFRPSRGSDEEEGIRVTAPPWVSLEIQGRETEVSVRGFEENVRIRSLEGDVGLTNLSGSLDVYTAEGEIIANGLTGEARLRTGDGDIEVRASSAELDVETVEGEIRLEHLESRRISAKGTGGEIEFTGRMLDGGQYTFLTHEGDVFLRLVPPVNLDATVLAYDGEFTSDFPVRATGFRSGEGIQFRTGEGGTRLQVETFSGEVRIRRLEEGRVERPAEFDD